MTSVLNAIIQNQASSTTQYNNVNAANKINEASIPTKAYPKDSFIKRNKKKIIAAGSIALVSAIIAACIIKRKDISKLIKKLKEKSQIKNIEEIILPENGKYNVANEPSEGFVQTYNWSHGFNFKTFGGKKNSCGIEKTLGSNHGDIGITKDGHAYIRAAKHIVKQDERFQGVLLLADGKNFSPAQKNLLALISQDKYNSPNSPWGKCIEDLGIESSDLPKEKIYELLGKWAQDIDVDDEKVKKMLSSLSKLKRGERYNMPEFLNKFV